MMFASGSGGGIEAVGGPGIVDVIVGANVFG